MRITNTIFLFFLLTAINLSSMVVKNNREHQQKHYFFDSGTILGVLKTLGEKQQFEEIGAYFEIVAFHKGPQNDRANLWHVIKKLSKDYKNKGSTDALYAIFRLRPHLLFSVDENLSSCLDYALAKANVHFFHMIHNTFQLDTFCECCFDKRIRCLDIRWIDTRTDKLITTCQAILNRADAKEGDRYNRFEEIRELFENMRSLKTEKLYHRTDCIKG